MANTTIAIDYDRIPTVNVVDGPEDNGGLFLNGHNHCHQYDASSSRLCSWLSWSSINRYHYCRKCQMISSPENRQILPKYLVPFSLLPIYQILLASRNTTRQLCNLTFFMSSRTRHYWWSLLWYILIYFLLLNCNHLVDSILVREGSEINRAPPAPVKGKSS